MTRFVMRPCASVPSMKLRHRGIASVLFFAAAAAGLLAG
jgi:hypothetical protein